MRRDPRRWIVDAGDFEPAPIAFAIVNGENSASGVGITPDIADDLFRWGADAITLGNHWYNKREIFGYLGTQKPIVRPINLNPATPGRGICIVENQGVRLAVVNLMGRVFMDHVDDPFRAVDDLLPELDTPHLFVDFHAEATSEKIAMGFHLAGKATAVIGTHTHVTTADDQILPGGTAYLSDVGMCGPWPSVLGMKKEIILEKFRTGMPQRFEVSDEPGVISGVVINVLKESGRATAIRRIRIEG